jgi:hypothetical protein
MTCPASSSESAWSKGAASSSCESLSALGKLRPHPIIVADKIQSTKIERGIRTRKGWLRMKTRIWAVGRIRQTKKEENTMITSHY